MAFSTEFMSERRTRVAEQLKKRPWFQATTWQLRDQLLTLPENAKMKDDWSPLLEDLAARPNVIGGIRVIRLMSLHQAKYSATLMFQVVNEDNGKEYTYEYVSWKHGAEAGAKGVVFVRTGDKITHFIVRRGEKFATGKMEWDTFGGFADLGADGVTSLDERILVEIREELGASDVRVQEVVDLGSIPIDASMTNNRPRVFAAIIDAGDAATLSPEPVNPDALELKATTVVLPVSQLGEHLEINGDPFFNRAVNLSVRKGLIPAASLAA